MQSLRCCKIHRIIFLSLPARQRKCNLHRQISRQPGMVLIPSGMWEYAPLRVEYAHASTVPENRWNNFFPMFAAPAHSTIRSTTIFYSPLLFLSDNNFHVIHFPRGSLPLHRKWNTHNCTQLEGKEKKRISLLSLSRPWQANVAETSPARMQFEDTFVHHSS